MRRVEVAKCIHDLVAKNNGVIIETEHYIIRPLNIEDHKGLMTEMYTNRYVNSMVVPNTPMSEDGAENKLKSFIDQYEKDGLSCWAIEERGTNKKLGIAGITYMGDEPNNNVELNIALHPGYIGKGIGRNIVEELKDHCFELLFNKLGFKEVYAETLSYNSASQALIRIMRMNPDFKIQAGSGSYLATQGEDKKDTVLTAFKFTKEMWERSKNEPTSIDPHTFARTLSDAMGDENLSKERRCILKSIYKSKKRPATKMSDHESSQLESDRVKRERNS
jgi:RimJ/RimL family protein N-acetyltransferase